MARTGEVFVIDGDDLIKKQPKAAVVKAGAGSETFPAGETRSSAPDVARSPSGHSARPPAAASLSLFVWGSGQWLNRDRDLAVLLCLWQVLIVALHYLVANTWGTLKRMAHIFFISEWEMLLYAAALDFWLIFLLVFNVSQAYRSAERQRGPCRGLRQPWLSGMLSILVPGWGQIVNGQIGKGSAFLFMFVTQVYLLGFYLLTPLYRIVSDLDPNQGLLRDLIWYGKIFTVVSAQLWLLSVYDAVLVARYTRNRAR